MLHIRPIPEEKATGNILTTYQDIKHTFQLESVPLLFQYIAGFEEYFLYVWEKIKQNVQSAFFQQSAKDVIDFSHQTIPHIYHPSRDMQSFITTLHPSEKQNLKDSIQTLEHINANLLLITLGMREGLKGVQIANVLLQQKTSDEFFSKEEVFDQFINNQIMRQNLKDQQNLQGASKMLAPLFGSQSIMISRYPEFFSKIAKEMEELVKKEMYLSTRVGLERICMLTVHNFTYPLGTSYKEIAQFAGRKPYFDELLYILSETFPTTFPRLVLTTGVMRSVLQFAPSAVVAQ